MKGFLILLSILVSVVIWLFSVAPEPTPSDPAESTVSVLK